MPIIPLPWLEVAGLSFAEWKTEPLRGPFLPRSLVFAPLNDLYSLAIVSIRCGKTEQLVLEGKWEIPAVVFAAADRSSPADMFFDLLVPGMEFAVTVRNTSPERRSIVGALLGVFPGPHGK